MVAAPTIIKVISVLSFMQSKKFLEIKLFDEILA